MRTFNWNKLPVNKIWGKKNIWSMLLKKDETNPNKAKIDFQDMESLFCQQSTVVVFSNFIVKLLKIRNSCFQKENSGTLKMCYLISTHKEVF